MGNIESFIRPIQELKTYQQKVDNQLQATDTGIDGDSCGVPLVLLQDETHNAIQNACDALKSEIQKEFTQYLSQRKEKGPGVVNKGLQDFIDTLQLLIDSGVIESTFSLRGKDSLGEDIFISVISYPNTNKEKHPYGIIRCLGAGNQDFMAQHEAAPKRVSPPIKRKRV